MNKYYLKNALECFRIIYMLFRNSISNIYKSVHHIIQY